MPPKLRQSLIELLKEYADIFALSYRDMPSLGREIVEHKSPLLLDSILVRQQLRRMKPGVVLKIKEEVEKQWNARFLLVAKYPQWVANIVPILKKDGKVQMCVDYKDLNRASPKDNFPLPHNVLVDNIAQHGNALRTQECQGNISKAMVALFHDMMHKEIEVYVDDMSAKSKTPGQHVEDLRKLFTRLQKYKLRLNLAKCIFGVKSGKLLGFVVNERGIKVDPNKVKAIWEMLAPRTESKNKLHSPVHFPTNSDMRADVQAHPQKTEDGLEFRLLEGLHKDQKVLRKSSRPRPDSTKEALDLILDDARRIHGLCLGAARCHRKERTYHLLPQQKVHKL
ncbi:putative protein K02A2.6, partial [Mucuna pruriens]